MGRRARLIGAALALLGLWLLVGWGATRAVDAPLVAWTLTHRVRGTSILAAALALSEMALIAGGLAGLYRRQPALLARLAGLLLAVAGAVWLLKHIALPVGDGWYAGNFPSGHTAAGATLGLLLLAAVRRLPLVRPAARVLGAAAAAFTAGFGLVALYPMGHSPTEVAGGFLLAGLAAQPGWAALGQAPPGALPGFLAAWARPSGPAAAPAPPG